MGGGTVGRWGSCTAALACAEPSQACCSCPGLCTCPRRWVVGTESFSRTRRCAGWAPSGYRNVILQQTFPCVRSPSLRCMAVAPVGAACKHAGWRGIRKERGSAAQESTHATRPLRQWRWSLARFNDHWNRCLWHPRPALVALVPGQPPRPVMPVVCHSTCTFNSLLS